MQSSLLHQKALSDHQSKAVRAIDAYWHHLAARGGIPRRADVDPAVIQDALEYAFIAEHLSGGHARMRVAGGAISAVMGMDVAGMPLAALIAPVDRSGFAQHVANTLDSASLLTLSLSAPEAFGQPHLNAKMRLYPLRDETGRIRQILGSFVSTGLIGQTPRRFKFSNASETPMSRDHALTSQTLATRGHLRLVVSNA